MEEGHHGPDRAGLVVRPWWRGFPSVKAALDVRRGVTHTISWRRGRLVLDDHRDVSGERVLALLGGERCACLDVLDAWRSATGAVAERPASIEVPPTLQGRSFGQGWFGADAFSRQPASPPSAVQQNVTNVLLFQSALASTGTGGASPASARRSLAEVRDEIEKQARRSAGQLRAAARRHDIAGNELFDAEAFGRAQWFQALWTLLPQELLHRHDLGCLVHQLRQAAQRESGSLADRLLHARAIEPLEASVAPLLWRHMLMGQVEFSCMASEPGTEPSVSGSIDDRGGEVVAHLRPSWVVDVYERGLTAIDGCFVVEVVDRLRTGEVIVRACRWEWSEGIGAAPVIATAVASRGELAANAVNTWHLRWC